MLTQAEVEEIERRAEQWVGGLALTSDDAFHAAVEWQLNRLTLEPLPKRRATALALAEVGLADTTSRAEVFRRSDTVGYRTFYDRDKEWYHGREFRDVLEHLIALYKRWSAGAAARAAADEFTRKVDALRKAEHDIASQMFSAAAQMASSPLWEVTVNDADGREVTWKPARWAWADLPRVAETASKLSRRALGMADGGRQEVALDWTQHLPDGVTPAQAEAAMESWARLLAAADRAVDEEDEDDD